VPFLIHRMDRSYAGRKHAEYVGGVIRAPSTYIKGGNLFFSAELTEQSLPYVAEMIGADTLLFTSDFPHEVNLAHCQAEIDAVRRRTDLSDDLQKKLLAENARRLYRFTD